MASFTLSGRNGRRGSYREVDDAERAEQHSLEPLMDSKGFPQSLSIIENTDEEQVDTPGALYNKPDASSSGAYVHFLNQRSSTFGTPQELVRNASHEGIA